MDKMRRRGLAGRDADIDDDDDILICSLLLSNIYCINKKQHR